MPQQNKFILEIKIIAYKILYKIIKKNCILDDIWNLNKKLLSFKNVTIGNDTIIYNCKFSSSSKGDFFEIGDNCTLTGVNFLGHDASPSLFINKLKTDLPPYYPGSRQSFRDKIVIGNNVFIGVNTIILPGVHIGNNIIIGAGSVVTKSLEDNGVYCGVPCKKVMNIEEYIKNYEEKLRINPELF